MICVWRVVIIIISPRNILHFCRDIKDFKTGKPNESEILLAKKRYEFYESQRRAAMTAVLQERKAIIRNNKKKEIFAAITAKSLQQASQLDFSACEERVKLHLM